MLQQRKIQVGIIIVLLLCLGGGLAANAMQRMDIELPYPDFSNLFEDEMQAIAAKAICDWYIAYNNIEHQWGERLWKRDIVVLSNPHIFKCDFPYETGVFIYCGGLVSAYGLSEKEDGTVQLVKEKEFFGMFRVYAHMLEDEWIGERIVPINQLEDEVNEGTGIDGLPWLMEALGAQVPDDAWTTATVLEKYLKSNAIEVTVEE